MEKTALFKLGRFHALFNYKWFYRPAWFVSRSFAPDVDISLGRLKITIFVWPSARQGCGF